MVFPRSLKKVARIFDADSFGGTYDGVSDQHDFASVISLPVWVRKCACRLFSRGNTRWQKLHLMLLGDVLPCFIRFVRASARGRPRRWLSALAPVPALEPAPPVPAPCSLYSGEEHELPGLRFKLRTSSFQLHGQNVSHIGGLQSNDSVEGRDSRFGVWNAISVATGRSYVSFASPKPLSHSLGAPFRHSLHNNRHWSPLNCQTDTRDLFAAAHVRVPRATNRQNTSRHEGVEDGWYVRAHPKRICAY